LKRPRFPVKVKGNDRLPGSFEESGVSFFAADTVRQRTAGPETVEPAGEICSGNLYMLKKEPVPPEKPVFRALFPVEVCAECSILDTMGQDFGLVPGIGTAWGSS
jgi:hypothetical protein